MSKKIIKNKDFIIIAIKEEEEKTTEDYSNLDIEIIEPEEKITDTYKFFEKSLCEKLSQK